MTRISICIATYNGALFIKRQLESVLNQLGEDDEIIISDDGSLDDTLLIIKKISDSRIKIFQNTSRHGPPGNFENALKLTSGNFIFLCDQDDIWFPNKINTLIELLGKFDLILSDCNVINENGDILLSSFFNFRGSRPGFFWNLYKNSYIGCCMAFRREVLTYVMPFPRTIYMHDWWIGLMVELRGNILFYNEPLVSYVRHGNNASPTGEGSHSWMKKIQNRSVLLLYIVKRILHLFFADR